MQPRALSGKESPSRGSSRRLQTLGQRTESPGKPAAAGPAEKRVTFSNKHSGKKLVGTLVQAPGTDKRVAVLCHGFASTRNSFHLPAIAERLAHRAVSSLRFDFAGNGESEGTFEFGNYAMEAEDIRAAVLFLRNRGLTVSSLVGHSKGGNSVLLYASIYDDVPSVVNVAGRFDLSRGVTERFGGDIVARLAADKQVVMEQQRDDGSSFEWTLTKWSLQDRFDTDMRAAAKKIRLSEVLTIHGSSDRTIPVEDAHHWGGLVANHELKVISGADHNFRSAEHAEQLCNAVVERCLL